MRLEGKPLTADLEDFLPDYKFAFEGSGQEAGGFYYTNARSQELNERFGDLLYKIRDLEVWCQILEASYSLHVLMRLLVFVFRLVLAALLLIKLLYKLYGQKEEKTQGWHC